MKQFSVIFDWDGTIADSFTNQYEWFKHWAIHPDNKGSKIFPFKNIEEFRRFYNEEVKKPGEVQNVYDSLGYDCDMKDPKHLVWSAYIAFKNENPVKIFPEMINVIKQIHELSKPSLKNNVRARIHINSSNRYETMITPLQETGLDSFIDSYVDAEVLNMINGGSGHHIKKPSKVSVAYSLGYLGTEGSNTLFFGDTLNDLEACKNVVIPTMRNKQNLICVGVTWGFETEENLKKGITSDPYNFDHVISKHSDILEIFSQYYRK